MKTRIQIRACGPEMLSRLSDWHAFSVELARDLKAAGLGTLASSVEAAADRTLLRAIEPAGDSGHALQPDS